jgi:hypothetical protein
MITAPAPDLAHPCNAPNLNPWQFLRAIRDDDLFGYGLRCKVQRILDTMPPEPPNLSEFYWDVEVKDDALLVHVHHHKSQSRQLPDHHLHVTMQVAPPSPEMHVTMQLAPPSPEIQALVDKFYNDWCYYGFNGDKFTGKPPLSLASFMQEHFG